MKLHRYYRIGLSIAACILFAAFPLRAEQTSSPTQTLNLPSISLNDKPQAVQEYWYEEAIQEGDSLRTVLQRLGIEPEQVRAMLASNKIDSDMLRLSAGQTISVKVNEDGNIGAIQFFNDDDNGEQNLIAIEKQDQQWQISANEVPTQTITSVRSAVVQTTAAGALSRAGVPVEIRTALNEMFSHQFDLTELVEGDSIHVLYESLYFRGQEIATGNILAAEITHNQKNTRLFYFEDQNYGNFFDDNGEIAHKNFTIAPIENAPISSPYGIRRHPILHSIKMHTGIDYAAASGTPIRAPSNGVVSFQGVMGGYGNVIMVDHGKGIETLYAHLSAFASGATQGKRIEAGQVIGFVGSTGRSTGAHLHYEVRVQGQTVNPATFALPAPKLSQEALARLKQQQTLAKEMLATLQNLPVLVAQQD